MYALRNTETLLCNSYCSGKAISITYYECVFVALGVQHAMCVPHIFIRGLSDSTIFFQFFSSTARLSKRYLTQNLCFDFIYNFCLKHFS
jgi:formate/nitrite transporter FocA (FNT family)